jgi:excisionase family DNA binding protein
MKEPEPAMLTVKQVAERLKVAGSSVRLWANQGRFPGARLESTPMGSYWLIPEAALTGFSKQKRGPKKKGSKR